MKYEVRRIKSMRAALSELQRFVQSAGLLERGRPIQNFGGLRPRELVANWLVCAVVNFERGQEDLRFTTDPTGNDCDGLIVDTAQPQEVFFTEHVFISERDKGEAEALILERIAHKNAHGAEYARNRTLVVFANGGAGEWFPNRIARRVERPFHFADLWVISLQCAGAGRGYVYGVTRPDLTGRVATVWHVIVSPDFDAWKVECIQAPPAFPLLGSTGPCRPS